MSQKKSIAFLTGQKCDKYKVTHHLCDVCYYSNKFCLANKRLDGSLREEHW